MKLIEFIYICIGCGLGAFLRMRVFALENKNIYDRWIKKGPTQQDKEFLEKIFEK